MPLHVPNGGRKCEYNDINVHDIIISKIPWLCMVVEGSTLPCSGLIFNPTWNPFLLPKHTPQLPYRRLEPGETKEEEVVGPPVGNFGKGEWERTRLSQIPIIFRIAQTNPAKAQRRVQAQNCAHNFLFISSTSPKSWVSLAQRRFR